MTSKIEDGELTRIVVTHESGGNGDGGTIGRNQILLAFVTLLIAIAPGVVSIIQAHTQGGEIADLKDELSKTQALLDTVNAQLASTEVAAVALDELVEKLEENVTDVISTLDADGLRTTYDTLSTDAQDLESSIRSYNSTVERAGNISSRLDDLEVPFAFYTSNAFDGIRLDGSQSLFSIYPSENLWKYGWGNSVTSLTPFATISNDGKPSGNWFGHTTSNNNHAYLWDGVDVETPYLVRAKGDGLQATGLGLFIPAHGLVMHPGTASDKSMVMISYTVPETATVLVVTEAKSIQPAGGTRRVRLHFVKAGIQDTTVLRDTTERTDADLARSSQSLQVEAGDQLVLSVYRGDDGQTSNDNVAVFFEIMTLLKNPVN